MTSVEKFLAYHRRDNALYTLLRAALGQDDHDLSRAQIRIVLHMKKGSLLVWELASILDITPQTAGQTLRKCVEAGLVEVKEGDEDDARSRTHGLTEAGFEALRLLEAILETKEVQAMIEMKVVKR